MHISAPHYHAQHYLGWSKDVDKRLETHWHGPQAKASKFLWHVKELGLTWELVRVWVDGTRSFEGYLKRKHNGRSLCPICNPNGPLGTNRYIVVTNQVNEQIELLDMPF